MSEKMDLPPNPANWAALTPISFLSRTAEVYPQHIGVIHGARRFTWSEVHERCRRFASALRAFGIAPGDTVAVMAPNVPLLLEAHFAVPMAGAILNAINTRLDPAAIAYILEHSEAKILIADTEYHAVIRKALALLPRPLRVIDSEDPEGPGGERLGEMEYEALLAAGDPAFEAVPPGDEWESIAVNYTSGTTGNPKGVLYHHRGAYLNALGNTLAWDFGRHPVYLWTLPMFHCNGWCFPWTVTLAAGTHVCLRRVDGAGILGRHRRSWRHPSLRRPHRDAADPRCGAGRARQLVPQAADDDRCRTTAGGGPGRDAGGRLRGHPCLWADRGLWTRGGLCLA